MKGDVEVRVQGRDVACDLKVLALGEQARQALAAMILQEAGLLQEASVSGVSRLTQLKVKRATVRLRVGAQGAWEVGITVEEV